jgi:hypothetical protein
LPCWRRPSRATPFANLGLALLQRDACGPFSEVFGRDARLGGLDQHQRPIGAPLALAVRFGLRGQQNGNQSGVASSRRTLPRLELRAADSGVDDRVAALPHQDQQGVCRSKGLSGLVTPAKKDGPRFGASCDSGVQPFVNGRHLSWADLRRGVLTGAGRCL